LAVVLDTENLIFTFHNNIKALDRGWN